MRVVVCEPGKAPEIRNIGSDLDSYQAIVGGYVEACPFYFASDGRGPREVHVSASIYCNENGLLDGLPPNRLGLLGTFFVSGGVDGEGNDIELSEDQAALVVRRLEANP